MIIEYYLSPSFFETVQFPWCRKMSARLPFTTGMLASLGNSQDSFFPQKLGAVLLSLDRRHSLLRLFLGRPNVSQRAFCIFCTSSSSWFTCSPPTPCLARISSVKCLLLRFRAGFRTALFAVSVVAQAALCKHKSLAPLPVLAWSISSLLLLRLGHLGASSGVVLGGIPAPQVKTALFMPFISNGLAVDVLEELRFSCDKCSWERRLSGRRLWAVDREGGGKDVALVVLGSKRYDASWLASASPPRMAKSASWIDCSISCRSSWRRLDMIWDWVALSCK